MQKDQIAGKTDVTLVNLHTQCAEQPGLMREATKMASLAHKTMLEKRKARDRIKSRKKLEVLSNPKKYNLQKTTDSVIESVVSLQQGVVEAEEDLIKAKNELDEWSGIVQALNERSKTLTHLIYLRGQGYYSDVAANVNGSEPEGGKIHKNLNKKDQ